MILMGEKIKVEFILYFWKIQMKVFYKVCLWNNFVNCVEFRILYFILQFVVIFLFCGYVCCCNECFIFFKECFLCRGVIVQRIKFSIVVVSEYFLLVVFIIEFIEYLFLVLLVQWLVVVVELVIYYRCDKYDQSVLIIGVIIVTSQC